MAALIDSLRSSWQRTLGGLKHKNMLRRPFVPSSPHIDFSTNDYLGLRHDPRLTEGGVSLARRVGAGSGASRMVVQSASELCTLEEKAAAWTGWPSAVFFPSGYMANIGLFETLGASELAEEETLELFLDHRAHASLHTACRLSGLRTTLYRHSDYDHLSKRLAASLATFKVIVTESLHSMDGTFEDAESLKKACVDHNALLVIDEAHSMGIAGLNGAGWLPENLREHTLAVMAGCGKALSVSGGFVLCTPEFKDLLFQKARTLLFTTGVSPFIVGALSCSLEIIQSAEGEERRKNLQENIKFARSLIQTMPYNAKLIGEEHSPILGLILSNEKETLHASEVLMEKGFMVRPIRPPTVPQGTSRLRIILHSTQTKQQIEQLISLLNELSP